MSEPKRYLTDSLIPGDDICPDAVGEVYAMVVRYADYARLKAEVERLELEVFAFDRTIKQASCHYDNRLEDIRQLQAEVDRLTNAGDAMAKLMFIDKDYIGSPKQEAVVEWCKATEGKQP